MALIFARLARNFIKAGYFPTDAGTLERLGNMLALPPAPQGSYRLLDPCCGEGTALADLRQMLIAREQAAGAVQRHIEALGIEFDKERAWHAKTVLNRVIHSDMHDVVVKPRSMGLLFLNPPYGFGVSDKAGRNLAEEGHEKAERLERTFLRKTVPYLAYGGVLVYIIPHYALDDDIRGYLVRNFRNLRVFMAPEKQFKQCVVIGIRCNAGYANKTDLQPLVEAQASAEGAAELPDTWEDDPYMVPAAHEQEINFHAVRMDEEQLRDELEKYKNSLLWGALTSHFNQVKGQCRPPLRDLTPWHQALALAAGQVTGAIRADNGRTFLIKGDTYKRKERRVETDINEKGDVSQTITLLDRFVPVINAIEFTPDHRLGQIVKIA
ncbi:SAM-dependent methyltransferase [Corticibacter populi]|uniref:SAM-dependent methyltransferase n=1 Tax=Corticibacter populi TaxID=1550736 RepID=A0A3M6QYY2_9BURK|nr:DUF6094 domain-containing protein [Corticibacter populi]RMX08217.1 SAM-dependent methyltransferase [Corticibacter populi]RZS35485.1 hypothetical protein EV687_0553 [Corticibacter populi]